MSTDELLAQARILAAEIKAARGERRYELHQRLHRTLENIKRHGGRVPAFLRELDHELVDEELEDVFDNMPV